MTSKTHIAASAAITSMIVQPNTITDLAICLSACVIGSVLPDIDVSTSQSHKELLKVFSISTFMIVICVIAEYFFKLGIFSYLQTQESIMNLIIGIISFLAVCLYGIHTSHRTFMHSIVGVFILTVIVDFAIPSATIAFVLGMLSHILLDLFNLKKIQLFYPLKKRIGFKLCSADGLVNNILFTLSSIIFIIQMSIFTVNLFT